jgi:hypothetical protein
MRWIRLPRANNTMAPAEVSAATLPLREVHQQLELTKVRCMVDTADDRVAGTVTVQLVLTNNSDREIEYRVESIKVDIQNRVAEVAGVLRPTAWVGPGNLAIISCPSIRGVDRTGSSTGNVDYSILYSLPAADDAPPAARCRRQHGIWFKVENQSDGTMKARFVERYDEDDILT